MCQTLTGICDPIESPSTRFTDGKTEAQRSACSWGSGLGQPDSRAHVVTDAVLGFPNTPGQEGGRLESGGAGFHLGQVPLGEGQHGHSALCPCLRGNPFCL